MVLPAVPAGGVLNLVRVCRPQVFAYDHCFWSIDEAQKDKFAGQFSPAASLRLDLFERDLMSHFLNLSPDRLNYLRYDISPGK